MASTSGCRPAATSFCIELWKLSGGPSNAARIGSGATSEEGDLPAFASSSALRACFTPPNGFYITRCCGCFATKLTNLKEPLYADLREPYFPGVG